MKLQHLLESPIYVDTNNSYEANNKATDYDWFYEYTLRFICHSAVAESYMEFKKRKPNDHVNAFLYNWQYILDDPEYHKGDPLLKHKDDMNEIDSINEIVGWNDNNDVVYDAPLDLGEVFMKGLPEPDFKFKEIKGAIYLESNRFTELPSWFPEKAESVQLNNNQFETLTGISKVLKECRTIYLQENKINRGVLDLLKIKGLRNVYLDNNRAGDAQVQDIITKYLPEGDMLECQSELIDAGLGSWTKK